jgi:sugar/nucleoside kinase (ribokinase family)
MKLTDRSLNARVLCSGVLVADLFAPPLDRLPEEGELLATEDFLLQTGGCAANMATCLARLGAKPHIAGRVGEDFFGDFIAKDLAAVGVETSGVRRSSTAGTSKTIVLPVKGEDRRFIHTFGANAEFRVSDIPAAAAEGCEVYYVGGYLVMPSFDQGELAELFRRGRAAGKKTLLDVVVPAGTTPEAISRLSEVLPHTDVFLPNDEEAYLLTGETQPARMAKKLLGHGCGAVVITQGARGTLYMSASETISSGIYSVDYVDGSGSGDAFDAGFTIGLIEGFPVEDTLKLASAMGASVCRMLGCTTGAFDRAQAEEFVAANELALSRL